MKYLVAVAIMSFGLYGLTTAGARAGDGPAQVIEHHSTQHLLMERPNLDCPKGPLAAHVSTSQVQNAHILLLGYGNQV